MWTRSHPRLSRQTGVGAQGRTAPPRQPAVRYTWPDYASDYPGARSAIPVCGPCGRVQQTHLTGNEEGLQPFSTESVGELRVHHEIMCIEQGCACRAYRSDVAKLQTLFSVIDDDQTFRGVFTVAADDEAITIMLAALRLARDTAKSSYGLSV